MSWNPNDYPKTYDEHAAIERAAAIAEDDAAFEAFESRRALDQAGVDRLMAFAAAAPLAAPASTPAPIADAINGWLTAQAIAGRHRAPAAPAPRYAEIGNGIFVRVGNGKKNRRAA